MNILTNLFLDKEITSQTGKVQFRRWKIFSTPWFKIYLHQILASDQDSHLHSHPWNFKSLILKGSYQEENDLRQFIKANFKKYLNIEFESWHLYEIPPYASFYNIYKAGNIISHHYEEAHRLTLLTPAVWTLVLTHGKRQPWGYVVSSYPELVENDRYRELKKKKLLDK